MTKKPAKEKITQSLPVPSVFGKYRIAEHLGRGGMGDVYKAEHLELGRMVALKVLPAELTTPESIDRFNAEAQAISRLQHQNIVTLYDFGTIEHRKYIAMQLVQGENMSDILHRKKRMEPEMVVHLGKQICRALFYAHSQGVIHRDVKTGNIMVEGERKAYLSDFGIAQVLGATRLTTTGMAMGTPEYMSPEQCEGKPLDHLCDIYGLGIVFYEMLTGRPPYTGENALAVAYKQVHEVPVLVSKIRPDIPPRFDLIIAKCLKKNKAERYSGADQLLGDLDSVFSTNTPTTPAATPKADHEKRQSERKAAERRTSSIHLWKNKSMVVFAGSIALIVALLIFLGGWFIGKNSDSHNPWKKPTELWWQPAKEKPVAHALPHTLTKYPVSILCSFLVPQIIQGLEVELSAEGHNTSIPTKLLVSIYPGSPATTLHLQNGRTVYYIPFPTNNAYPALTHLPVRIYVDGPEIPITIHQIKFLAWERKPSTSL